MKFVLPESGKEIEWEPLTVGTELAVIAATNDKALLHLRQKKLLSARILKIGGGPMTHPDELGTWSSLDYEEFAEHVDIEETRRKIAFRKKRNPEGMPGITAQVQAAMEAVQSAAHSLSVALGNVLELAKLVEDQSGPLAKGSETSSP